MKLKEAKKIGAQKGVGVGIALGTIFFFIFAIYGAGFWFGAFLISERIIDGGTVLAVFFAVVTAALSLGQALPNLQNFFEAAGAAGTIYETIDRVSLLMIQVTLYDSETNDSNHQLIQAPVMEGYCLQKSSLL